MLICIRTPSTVLHTWLPQIPYCMHTASTTWFILSSRRPLINHLDLKFDCSLTVFLSAAKLFKQLCLQGTSWTIILLVKPIRMRTSYLSLMRSWERLSQPFFAIHVKLCNLCITFCLLVSMFRDAVLLSTQSSLLFIRTTPYVMMLQPRHYWQLRITIMIIRHIFQGEYAKPLRSDHITFIQSLSLPICLSILQDILDDLLPHGSRSLPKPPNAPPCWTCACRNVSATQNLWSELAKNHLTLHGIELNPIVFFAQLLLGIDLTSSLDILIVVAACSQALQTIAIINRSVWSNHSKLC